MKKFILPVVIIVAAGLVGFFIVTKQITSNPKSEIKANYLEASQQQRENLRQATIKIDGMFCASCATGAEYALKEKDGVIDASVEYNNENGIVTYDSLKISKDEIIQAVEPYTATIIKDVLLK